MSVGGMRMRGFAFFFFQAEDGIRDKLVTGVQTCALPISGAPARLRRICPVPESQHGGGLLRPWIGLSGTGQIRRSRAGAPAGTDNVSPIRKIGRASCRERV